MIVSTTNTIENQPVKQYLGLVSGETIIGANIVRDLMAGIRDIVGGRATAYEKSLQEAKETAIKEMLAEAQSLGANAVIGVDLDFETIGQGSMLMVSASGTAVILSE